MLNEIALRQPQAGTWEAACDCAVLISSPWAVLLPTLGTLVPGSPPPSLYSLVSFFLCVLFQSWVLLLPPLLQRSFMPSLLLFQFIE